jgi:aspartate carbamoyltransferase catalytic subunit
MAATLHMLGLESLSASTITALLDRADGFRGVGRECPKRNDLAGKLVVNLFFEPSTRTKISFALATRRLGGETQDFSPAGSSTSKGETLIDTARNIAAMGIDAVVVRHTSSGAPGLLADALGGIPIINAGDGAHEHPTQGLLDMLTIRRRKGRIDGLTVALVGDILHSRVARSNIHGLTKLGATVILCGPPTLVPAEMRQFNVEIAHSLDEILSRCDVINLLRVQFERQRSAFFPSVGEYAHLFGMNGERLSHAKPDVLILAPGPINRGVELTPDVADGPNSAILEQVENGLAVRMAVLSGVCQPA